jgi:hypothetical protein
VLRSREHYRAPAGLYYEVAGNGVFQVREGDGYRSVIRVFGGVPGLLPARECVELRCPRLPARQLAPVLAFFREVHERWGGEAIVMLFYDGRSGAFRIEAPPQTVWLRRSENEDLRAVYRLDYRTAERPPGFVRFGSIHSHSALPAVASSIDHEEERFEEGLHAIYGSFSSERLTRSACFVSGGVRFPLDPADVLEECAVPAGPAPREWMAQLELREERGDGEGRWTR